jgi:cytochrome oxidase assembly protein ShyY1
MSRKLPLVPTILVGLAVAVMIGLGFWQLERREQKLALLESYRAAAGLPPIGWPSLPPKEPLPLFRSATGNCLEIIGFRTAAGQNLKGEPGYLVIADCRTGVEGPGMAVELGWTKNPNAGKSYAVQWFLFAGIAALIYVLALRQRWRKETSNG